MRDMKVSKKLVIAFGVVILITALLGGTAIICTLNVDSSYSVSFNENAVPLPYIDHIVNALGQLRLEVRNAVIYENGSEAYNQALSQVSYWQGEVESSITAYEQFVNGEAELKMFNEFKNSYHNDLLPVAQGILDGVASNDLSQLESLMGQCNDIGAVMTTTLEELMQNAVTAGVDSSDANSAMTMTLVFAFSAFVIIALVISVIMMRQLLKGIKDPIVMLAAAAEKIATGDINVAVEANSKDEIGDLARSFGHMIEGFQEQARVLDAIAEGNYTVSIEPRSNEDIVGKSIVRMLDNNNKMVGEIRVSSEQVASGSQQISQASQNLASGSSEQAATIQQFSAAITEVQNKAESIADIAGTTLQDVRDAGDKMGECTRAMDQMLQAMTNIDESSQNISKVIKVIDDIAFQTNILALNAAVEAARAGQHGKGFAVVADEVRNLASKSAAAAKETAALIENSLQSVMEGNNMVGVVNSSLKEVEDISLKNLDSISQMDQASKEQSTQMEEITSGIGQLSSVVQANSATAEETAASSEEMSAQAAVLSQIVARFQLRESGKTARAASRQPSVQPDYEAEPDYAMSGMALASDKY